MIIELQEVKDILGITAETYDDRINTLLPIVQDEIICYLNNLFPDRNTKYIFSDYTLTNDTKPTITDNDSQFLIEGFAAGMDIALEGTDRNKGVYSIASITASVITLSERDELLDEVSSDEYGNASIRITRINWPKGIKRIMAYVIWENIDRAKNQNIKSKSLGPSSITFMDLESGEYSPWIINGLKKVRQLRSK